MCDKGDIVSFLGYHGTASCCMESIDKYGFDPENTKEKDDHWLGNGVYFFDKELLAK